MALVTYSNEVFKSFSDLSILTSGISVYRFAFGILCFWPHFTNISVELWQTDFIFHASNNYTEGVFYRSPVTQGYAVLQGLQLNTSYKVEIAVGFPRSKLLWPVVQPIQSMTLSTLDTSEFETTCCGRFRSPFGQREAYKQFVGNLSLRSKVSLIMVTISLSSGIIPENDFKHVLAFRLLKYKTRCYTVWLNGRK